MEKQLFHTYTYTNKKNENAKKGQSTSILYSKTRKECHVTNHQFRNIFTQFDKHTYEELIMYSQM